MKKWNSIMRYYRSWPIVLNTIDSFLTIVFRSKLQPYLRVATTYVKR